MNARPELGALARSFINQFQGGFPLAGRPFRTVSAKLGTTEVALISLIERLLADGFLSRFGCLYDAARLGGDVTLAALSAPDEVFDEIAGRVNEMTAVAHNYRRNHELNMWFVVATESRNDVASTLTEITRRTGLRVYDFPKLREFYLGLWLHLPDDGMIDTVPVPRTVMSSAPVLDALDRRIIADTQAGLPLTEEPCETLAAAIGVEPWEVVQRLAQMVETGVIRRIGAIPNHYRLGLCGNAMTVWDVPDERVAGLGAQIGRLPFVSHCYERPRHPGVWPYNLFAMVHGCDRDAVISKVAQIADRLRNHCRAHDVLFSTAVLKKTGLRLAA